MKGVRMAIMAAVAAFPSFAAQVADAHCGAVNTAGVLADLLAGSKSTFGDDPQFRGRGFSVGSARRRAGKRSPEATRDRSLLPA